MRAFDPGVGRDAEADREREIERLHAKIGRLSVEQGFFSQEVRKMAAPDRRALVARSKAADDEAGRPIGR